jgi:hypothetical protein
MPLIYLGPGKILHMFVVFSEEVCNDIVFIFLRKKHIEILCICLVKTIMNCYMLLFQLTFQERKHFKLWCVARVPETKKKTLVKVLCISNMSHEYV